MTGPSIAMCLLPNGDVAAVNPDGTCLLMFLQTEPGWYLAGDPVNALMLCHRPDHEKPGKVVLAFEAEDSGFEPAHVQHNKLRAFAEDFATCARIPKP